MPVIESAEEFINLVRSDDPADRKRAAWDQAPIDVWWQVFEEEPDLRFAIARNRTVPHELMVALIADPQWRVRGRVAAMNACPSDILLMLANERHDAVASSVATHPNTPTEALRVLAHHPWIQVREKALRQLSAHSEPLGHPATQQQSSAEGDRGSG